MKKLLLALALVLLTPLAANAADCYWVAGTSYNNSADWASTNGGAGGSCAATGGIPKNAGDVAHLDTSAPAATTLLVDIDIPSIATIDMRNLTGGSGLDFTTHNVTFTTSFLASSSTTTRSLSLGSGTITINSGASWSMASTTGMTFTPGTATIVLNGGSTQISFFGGGKTYNAITLNGNNAGAWYSFESGTPTNVNVGTLTINGPAVLVMRQAQTITVTNAFNFAGTASAPIYFNSDSASAVAFTLSAATGSTCQWCIFRDVTGSSHTITATNSLDLGGNGGTLSITAPTGGGTSGGYIIGGQ